MKKTAIPLNTEAHRPMFTALADLLRDVRAREGLSSSEAFNTFVSAAFYSLRGITLQGERKAENEKQYMGIVARCQHPKETMNDYAAMMAEVMRALQAEPIDFIGPVFSELCASPEMGQFFTPHHLSSAMARLTFADAHKMLEGREVIRCCEPACGVGGMVLAANQVLREMGIDVTRCIQWQMTEIDRRAFQCAYLQVALTETAAAVIHGNTLSMEVWETCYTPAAYAFGLVRDHAPPKPPEARIRTRTLVPV